MLIYVVLYMFPDVLLCKDAIFFEVELRFFLFFFVFLSCFTKLFYIFVCERFILVQLMNWLKEKNRSDHTQISIIVFSFAEIHPLTFVCGEVVNFIAVCSPHSTFFRRKESQVVYLFKRLVYQHFSVFSVVFEKFRRFQLYLLLLFSCFVEMCSFSPSPDPFICGQFDGFSMGFL